MDSFNERKAEEYVERFGVNLAIEQLGILAIKSVKAKDMMDYIMSKYKKELPKPKKAVVVRRDSVDTGRPKPEDRRTAVKTVLSPKERFLNLMNMLKLDFDLPTDGDFHPFVEVEWKRGYASINGFGVNFPSEDADFMFKEVKSRPYVKLRMCILSVNSAGVIAKPDVEEFYRRQANAKKEDVRKFCGTVIIGERGIFIRAENKELRKRIIVPQRFMSRLLLDAGKWMFRVFDERRDFIIAEPVEKVDTRVVDLHKKIVDLHRKMHEHEQMKKQADRPVERLVDNRLEQLKSNGSIQL